MFEMVLGLVEYSKVPSCSLLKERNGADLLALRQWRHDDGIFTFLIQGEQHGRHDTSIFRLDNRQTDHSDCVRTKAVVTVCQFVYSLGACLTTLLLFINSKVCVWAN